MDPVSLDLQLARFSGLTSLNLLCSSHFGHTEEDVEQGLHQIWRQNFTLRPEALEKLFYTSASLQKLWVAFTEDTEVLIDLTIELVHSIIRVATILLVMAKVCPGIIFLAHQMRSTGCCVCAAYYFTALLQLHKPARLAYRSLWIHRQSLYALTCEAIGKLDRCVACEPMHVRTVLAVFHAA